MDSKPMSVSFDCDPRAGLRAEPRVRGRVGRRIGPVALAVLALAAAGCAGPKAGGKAGAAPGGREGAPEEKAEALHQAKHALHLLELKGELSKHQAQRSLEAAEREVRDAERALEAWTRHEGPSKAGEAELDLQRMRNRLTDTRLELEELEAMYAEHDFAEATKELVLSRGRRNLQVAEEATGLAERNFQFLVDEEMPKRQADLEHALMRAKAALEARRLELRMEELEHAEALRQAKRKLAELQGAEKGAAEKQGAEKHGAEKHGAGKDA